MEVYNINKFDKHGKLIKTEGWCVSEIYECPGSIFFEGDIHCETSDMDKLGGYLLNAGIEIKCLGSNKCKLNLSEDITFTLKEAAKSLSLPYKGEDENKIVRRKIYKVVGGPVIEEVKKWENSLKIEKIIEKFPRDKYLAKIAPMDLNEEIVCCAVVYPPVTEVRISDEPELNCAYKGDRFTRKGKNIFPFSRASTRIVFHTPHENEEHSIQIVTRVFYTEVMQQMISIPVGIEGREKLMKSIDDFLKYKEFTDFNAEEIIKVMEKQKDYIEGLAPNRTFKKGFEGGIGIEIGKEFFDPEEIAKYMKLENFKVYMLSGYVE